MSLSVVQNEAITLPAVFYDMGGFLSDVDSLTVSIYPYGKKPSLDYVTTADAVVLDATPTNTGLGHYTYEYTVPESAHVGTWYSLWEGTLGTATVTAMVEFSVTPSAGSSFPGSQLTGEPVLNQNMLYTVKLVGIKDTLGASVDATCWFTSKYSPMCTTYNAVASKLNSLVSDLTEDTVNYLIYTATKEAHAITPAGVSCNSEYLAHACKMYVEYWVCLSILGNVISAGGGMLSKQLGDLKVSYANNSGSIDKLMDDWKEEMMKWEAVINSNGCISYGGSLPMGIAHPGIHNPDRPNIGRQIREPIGSSQLANNKALLGNRTRYQHSYTRPGVPGYYSTEEAGTLSWFNE